MEVTRAQWEHTRQEALKVLAGLEFNPIETPHFILMTGDHDEVDSLGCTCRAFTKECSDILKEKADGPTI